MLAVAAILLVLAFVLSHKVRGSSPCRFLSYRPSLVAIDERYRVAHAPCRPRLEALEVRYCLAFPITWIGNDDGLWTTAANWSTNSVPTDGSDVIFDGSHNANCWMNTNPVVNSVTFQNGYTGNLYFSNPQLTQSYSLEAVSGVSLVNFNQQTLAYQRCNMSFGTNSTLMLGNQGTSVIYNAWFSGGPGSVYVAGTLNLETPSGGEFRSAATIDVQGTINMQNVGLFDVTSGANLEVASGGSVSIVQNDPANITVADSFGGGIFENYGTFSYTGNPNATVSFDMPILNDGGNMNLGGGGTLYLDTLNTIPSEGTSIVNDGTLRLSGGITLNASWRGFYQGTGDLFDMDTADNGIGGGNNGITIDGGLIQFYNGFGGLWFTGNLNFQAGMLAVWINGAQGGAGNANFINDVGTVTISNNATLWVGIIGQLAPNQVWNIISASNGFGIGGDLFGHYNLQNPRQQIFGNNYQLLS